MQSHIQKPSSPQLALTAQAKSVNDSSAISMTLQHHANLTGLPDNLKSGIEALSGYSMDDVRVHYNSSKPATVQALAYTQGTDIHVAPGQEKHLPHEAWHVAQQMAGRVSPTTNINGMPVNDNAGLEHEADVMGEKAVQCKEYACQKERKKQYFHTPIQCYRKENGYVFSENEMYAVKDNEASTVYLHKDKNNTSVKQKLESLGICNSNADSSVLKDYNVYKQVNDAKITYGDTEKKDQRVDSEDDLKDQLSFVQKLINACLLLKTKPDKEQEPPSFLKGFSLPESPDDILVPLGKDIAYAYNLIKKWIEQSDQVDQITLNVVLGDLELRLSQIIQELKNQREEYGHKPEKHDGMRTECRASDEQRRRILCGTNLFGVDIEVVDKSKEYLVRWDNHYSTLIGNDGNDFLCIEDASGKSRDKNHLAKAHWFARIYGQPNQGESPSGKAGVHPFNIPVPESFADKLKDFKLSLISKSNKKRKLKIHYEEKSFYYKYEGDSESAHEDDFLLQTAYSVLNGVLVRMHFTEKRNYEIQYGPLMADILWQDSLAREKKKTQEIARLEQLESEKARLEKTKDEIACLEQAKDNIEEGIGLYDLVSMEISALEQTLIEIEKEIKLANLEQSEEQRKDNASFHRQCD